MSAPEFNRLLTGLSGDSRFAQAWSDAPKHVHSETDRDELRAAAMR